MGNTSNTLTLTVEKKETSINIDIEDGEIVIELPDDATCNVVVNICGKEQTVPVKNGKAVADISDLGRAKHDVKVDYPGDGKYIITSMYKDCRQSNTIEVLLVLTAEDLTKKYGTPDQFVATLVDGQGKAFSNQTVQFNINGVMYNRVTDASGQARLNINLMPGEYIITSSYNGSNIANKITVRS